MTRVLIAVDGSDESVEVARTARRLFGDASDFLAVNCAPFGVAVPFGAVYPMPAVALGMSPVQMGAVDGRGSAEAAEEAAEVADHTATDAGISDVEAVGEVGDPVEAILRAASEHSADVIVVGSCGRGWFSRLLEPSVAEAVRRRAPIPVLFVKADDPHGDDTGDAAKA